MTKTEHETKEYSSVWSVRLTADHVDFVQLLLQSSRASIPQAALGRQSVSEPHRIKNGHDGIDWLVTRRAFYAELAPQPEHPSIADHLYVMKDCGIMTAINAPSHTTPSNER
jgi:hypothetical protein